ncbi:hypothetical protein [Lichenibacterium dinghuense]|uniref:hypothetical protein n=1 Tax=Lichenibacterium dinghuense TaxID=2895977 RepID=UPI001F299029|nr:hypothetical protein [Lichenibacterium sp. 6Y81]
MPHPAAEPETWPPRRRSFALPGVLIAMALVAAASGGYMVWHAPLAPDPDGGLRCTRAFDARMRAARGGSDADLLKLSDEALAAGCGRQSYDAADLVGAEAAARLCARPAAAADAALKILCTR